MRWRDGLGRADEGGYVSWNFFVGYKMEQRAFVTNVGVPRVFRLSPLRMRDARCLGIGFRLSSSRSRSLSLYLYTVGADPTHGHHCSKS